MIFHVFPGSSGFYRSIFQHFPIIEPSIGRGRFSKLQMSSSRGQSHKFNLLLELSDVLPPRLGTYSIFHGWHCRTAPPCQVTGRVAISHESHLLKGGWRCHGGRGQNDQRDWNSNRQNTSKLYRKH